MTFRDIIIYDLLAIQNDEIYNIDQQFEKKCIMSLIST